MEETKILDKKYFKEIDTKEKAYFFGLLYADGSIYKRKDRPGTYRIQLKLQEQDEYIIQKFKEAIKTDINIRKEKDGSRLIFTNKEIAEDLISHGCIENKSKIKKFPEIKKELFWDFLRGYFDGNGSVGILKTSTYFRIFTGSKDFAEGLKNELALYGIKINIFDNSNSSGTWELSTGKKEQVKIISEKMYEETELFLTRKKEKFKI